MTEHHQILIVGGGNAGLSVAAQLLNKDPRADVAIIEPSDKHYYQPAWTLVAAGEFDINDTVREEKDYIPKGAKWLKDAVVSFEPAQNQVTCASGKVYGYEVLIVAPGIQMNWDDIKGLRQTLGKNAVTSNYSFDLPPYTWELIRNFKGGQAVFVNPPNPIRCGGAPHKIMYLACDYWRKKGILDQCEVHYVSGGSVIFGIEEYARTLRGVLEKNNIKAHYGANTLEIDGGSQTIVFESKDSEGNLSKQSLKFDFCHAVPPQSAPDFIKASPLADPNNQQGYVEIDKHTLQHSRFANVFACGDCTNAPASKTGAAIRKQAPVVVQNVRSFLAGQPVSARYEGYSACPIPTGYGKLMLAEFDYSHKPTMTFPFDQAKPRFSMWVLKKYLLPWLYWNKILKGRA